jgi:hypothetical protein
MRQPSHAFIYRNVFINIATQKIQVDSWGTCLGQKSLSSILYLVDIEVNVSDIVVVGKPKGVATTTCICDYSAIGKMLYSISDRPWALLILSRRCLETLSLSCRFRLLCYLLSIPVIIWSLCICRREGESELHQQLADCLCIFTV